MAQQIVNIGIAPNTNTGDPIRTAFTKINDNFTELYTFNLGQTAGSSSQGFVNYSATTKTAGQFYGGTTTPDSTTRLNFDGYFYATQFYGGGSQLTNLSAGNLSGTIPSAVLGNSSFNIGTTSIALNRASASQSLTGVSIDGNAGTVTNGIYSSGSYADPVWITSLNKTKVGLGNVENTALSTWAGSTNITTIGAATASSLSITGNLTVNGTTTTVNSTTVTIDDPILTLGGDTAPTIDDNKDRGIEFRWHNGTSSKIGFFGFDDSTGKFTFIPDTTNTSEVFSGTKGTIDANLDWADVLNKPDPVVTVTLTGDVTGTANTTLTDLASGTISITTAVAADSVALGTDTTGNYVASVATTSPLSGGAVGSEGGTLTLSLASGYGDTQNPFASKTANTFLAAPNGSAGAPTFRAIVAADVPTLNQSTTGNAGTATAWQTARTLTIGATGKSVDGSANVSWTLAEMGAYAATNPSGYTTNTGTVTSVGGTGTVSGLTLTGTVTTTGNLTLGGTLSASIDNLTDEHRIFNNMGDIHVTRTAFDASTPSYNFGWRFIQGSTNGPNVNSASQYYSLYVGLGNDYAATGSNSHGMQLAVPRNVTTPYLAIRYNENNSLGAWQKISAGYADSTGSVSTSTSTGISSSFFTTINTTTPGTGTYGINFVGHSTPDNASGITWSWAGSTAQAGIYVQSSGAYGTRMFLATTDSFATGAKTAVSIDHLGNTTLNRGTFQTGSVWINNGTNNNNYNENIRLFNAPNGVSVIAFSASGVSGTPTTSILGYSDRQEIRFNDGWQQRVYNGYAEAAGSYRAPIFYDSNNTGYYTDPASTSVLNYLQVGNHIEQGNNLGRPNVNWSASGTSTGMVIFYIPGVSPGNYGMLHMVFDIYEYVTGRTATVIIGGHNWSTSWYNIGCNVVGFTNKSIRLGVKDGRYCVVFGTSGSSWEYGTIVLRKVHNAGFYDNIVDMNGNWSATQTTTESFTNVTGDLRELRTSNSLTAGGSIESGADVRAPIFYDSNDTGYYVNPNSSSRLNVIYCGDVYNDLGGWFRSYGTAGLYSQSYGNHFYPTSDQYWNIAGNNGSVVGLLLRTGGHQGTVRGYVYADSSNNIGFLGSSGNWKLRVVGDDYSLADGSSMRAQLFYDSNDTTYYVDPASNGTRAAYLNGNLWINPKSEGYGEGIAFNMPTQGVWGGIRWVRGGSQPANWAFGYFGNESNNDIGFHNGTNGWRLDHSFNNTVNGSFRAPIFYDSNNTGYYTDPASTSNLNILLAQDFRTGFASGGGGYNFGANHYSMGKDIANGTWSAPHYSDLIIGYHTGIRLGANYSGIRFYNNSPTTDANNDGNGDNGEALLMTVGGYVGTANHTDVVVNNNLFANVSMRSPIFYDSNDTGYYLDPNSTVNNALRIRGGTLHGPNPSWGAYLYVGTDGRVGSEATVAVTNGNLHLDSKNGYQLYLNWYSQENIYSRGNFGVGDSSASHRLHVYGTGFATSDFRAPIFYDSNDTGYYIDAASTSVLNRISTVRTNDWLYLDNNYGHSVVGAYDSTRLQGVFAMGNSYKLSADGTSAGSLYGLAWSHPNAGSLGGASNLNDHGLLIINNGSFRAALSSRAVFSADVRGTLFYDYNDTAYSLDPASTSVLWRPSAATQQRWSISWRAMDAGASRPQQTGDSDYWTTTVGWGTDRGTWANYWKYGFGGFDCWGTSTDHPQGAGYIHAQGIQSGLHNATTDGSSGYGWQMVGAHAATDNRYWARGKWGGSTSSWKEFAMYGGGGAGDLRASLFYDSDNTGYYTDPASTSNLNVLALQRAYAGYDAGVTGSFSCNNWFRSSGNTGWYNASYDGGIYMEDTTWVRVYASKAFYVNNQIAATGDVTSLYSDSRLKTNLGTIKGALQSVLKLSGFRYVNNELAKSFGYTSEKVQLGVSAQEVEALFPEIVSMAPFDMHTNETSGEITSKSGNNYKTVAYDKLVPVLIEAIKEQQQIIDAQEERINRLEKLVEKLTQ